VYDELNKDVMKRQFTIGIVDDVTHLSLEESASAPNVAPAGTIACKFWGLGGDGTVGANKNSIKIIGDHTDKFVQAYFQYDSKKTGGVTISHLRFGDKPIKSSYYINKADFVACHVPAYITKNFPIVRDVKPGGTFLISCQWSDEELGHHLDAASKRYIAANNIQVYTIDAIDLAAKIGMGKRTNTILQSAFFSLAKVMPEKDAIQYMKDAATHSYLKKGQDVVDRNHKAIDLGTTAYKKFTVPADWATAKDVPDSRVLEGPAALVEQVKTIMEPVDSMDGDSLPVSAFVKHVDGQFEQGAAAYEKRGVAVSVPTWDPAKCIQCNNCAYVCPHATIRPFALTEEEAKAAPAAAKIADVKAGKGKGVYKYTMAISPLDCMGCGVCVGQCPVGAITMVPQEQEAAQQDVFNYCVAKVSEKKDMQDLTVKGSQFLQPMLEFSGSCAGCAETSYARLVTQLFGERMYISNATGCSSIWGGPASISPYCTNKEGRGPAWSNSLFEDNAEHGLGMLLGQQATRNRLADLTRALIAVDYTDADLKAAAKVWLDTMDDGKTNADATRKYVAELEASVIPNCPCDACKLGRQILADKEFLAKKSMWVFGGDGWAYDIGFGGVDHVLASGNDINIFVFDTEVYSNTGGQASKASNIGQVAQFAAAGKEIEEVSGGDRHVLRLHLRGAGGHGRQPGADHQGHRRGRGLSRPVPDHRLRPLRDALHQGRHDELPEGNEEGSGLRLLEPVPVQPRRRGRQVHPRLQGAGRRLSGIPDERGPLFPPDPRVPRPRHPAVRKVRGGGQGSLRASAQAQDHVCGLSAHRFPYLRKGAAGFSRGSLFRPLRGGGAGRQSSAGTRGAEGKFRLFRKISWIFSQIGLEMRRGKAYNQTSVKERILT
jgi:pyruvate-ferredoxin/flavodoxin oxidoreductase